MDTVQSVGAARRFRRDTVDSVNNRIMTLQEFGILGKGFEPSEIVKPDQVTIVNFSGTETSAERIMVAAILRRIFSMRKLGQLPSFVCVAEEAHRYAPSSINTVSKGALTTLVKEGRKFGASLVAVSQSPKDLDPDILKLCNSRLIFRLDNPSDLAAIRPYTGSLPEEILETLPFFPSGRAILSGLVSTVPLIVDIRERQTIHGATTAETAPAEIDSLTIEKRAIAPRESITARGREGKMEEFLQS